MINCVQPFISVIVPVYNGEAFIAEALQSIVQQHYQPLEIIVVDDGSTDKTTEIAAHFHESVRYVQQTNGGPAAARNRGLALAQGEIIAFLDADDLWPRNKLQVQLPILQNNPTLDLVWGHYQTLVLTKMADCTTQFISMDAPALNPLLGSMLIRKHVFTQVGDFDPTLAASEDVDWLLRVREQSCTLKVISEVTLFYRLHGHNMTYGRDLIQLNFTQVLKRSLDRRRMGMDKAAILSNLIPT